jgi:hypothetical protein
MSPAELQQMVDRTSDTAIAFAIKRELLYRFRDDSENMEIFEAMKFAAGRAWYLEMLANGKSIAEAQETASFAMWDIEMHNPTNPQLIQEEAERDLFRNDKG